MSKTIVSSWDEWSPLKHIIVGRADHSCVVDKEPAYDYEPPADSPITGRWGPRPLESIEKANVQLDGFSEILKKRGIIVDRPTPIQWNQAVNTPDFQCKCQHGVMPPRDILLTIGREMLSTSMAFRCRYFEYLAYWPLMKKYFDEDPNFLWEQSPRPRLSDSSYRPGYSMNKHEIDKKERLEQCKRSEYVLLENEVLFDAADVMRCGKDLFVQESNVTNKTAMEWLRRHYPDHRIHRLHFPENLFPMHIDATFVPLRPGIILNNRSRPILDEHRAIFEKNGWEIVVSAKPAHEEPPYLCDVSIWLSMNVLVVDPKTICVEETEVYQMEQFDKLGFDVIPVPLRDAYAFGGGLHCCTADVRREGKCEDYFPNQVPGTQFSL